MDEQNFYVVLPSNASTITFPANNQHTFKIKIPALAPLKGNWNVGLAEIQFPVLWKNVIDGYLTVRFEEEANPLQCKLHDGIYETLDELLEEIFNALSSAQLQNDVVLRYDKILNRISLDVRDKAKGFAIGFSKNIMNMLGLTKKEGEYYKTGTYVGTSPDISEGFSALYIYSNVVQSRIVGDTMAPLLRVVPLKRKEKTHPSSVNWVRFQHVQYSPVNKTQSDTIEVNIRRDNGDVVPFESGKVVLTLHFKKQ